MLYIKQDNYNKLHINKKKTGWRERLKVVWERNQTLPPAHLLYQNTISQAAEYEISRSQREPPRSGNHTSSKSVGEAILYPFDGCSFCLWKSL